MSDDKNATMPDGIPTCTECDRKRTIYDVDDYSPLQIISMRPLGWYSHPKEGDICGTCMWAALRNN
jgi:hypothetical protein